MYAYIQTHTHIDTYIHAYTNIYTYTNTNVIGPSLINYKNRYP